MPNLNSTLEAVTRRIEARSESTRTAYLAQMEAAAHEGPVTLAVRLAPGKKQGSGTD